jgi:hypothetical protein
MVFICDHKFHFSLTYSAKRLIPDLPSLPSFCCSSLFAYPNALAPTYPRYTRRAKTPLKRETTGGEYLLFLLLSPLPSYHGRCSYTRHPASRFQGYRLGLEEPSSLAAHSSRTFHDTKKPFGPGFMIQTIIGLEG